MYSTPPAWRLRTGRDSPLLSSLTVRPCCPASVSEGVSTLRGMPREPRMYRPGRRHHITNRASLGRAAFRDDDDRRFFLWILSELQTRFEVDVECFCLMTTHYHLILAGEMDDIAAAMHRLGFLYTQYFNNRHEADGPLFSDRYYSKPIHDEEYHRNAVRYIHRNPLAIDRDMNLARYRWSSHGVYLGQSRLSFVAPQPALELFGGSRDVYKSFVDESSNDMQPGDLGVLRETVDVVTSTLPGATARQRRTARAIENELFCFVGRRHLGTSTIAIAGALGCSPSSVRNRVARAEARRQQDKTFVKLLRSSIEKIGPQPDLPSWWVDSWGI